MHALRRSHSGMNASTFFVLVSWCLSVTLLPTVAIMENGGWPTGIATVGSVCMFSTSMPLVKEFCQGHLPATLSDVYRDVMFDLSMCSAGVLLSVRVATDPDGGDALVYISALAAISISVTRSCSQLLPAPVGDANLVELRGLGEQLNAEASGAPA